MADNNVLITLDGKIDSNNAADVERAILKQLEGHEGAEVVLDAEKLEYISSAGLRVILRLKKNWPEMKITGVRSEVYEILEMTGFTEMMTVEKGYRVVSVEGCEEIGRGANGKIYRIDQDNVVKVYKHAEALQEIQHRHGIGSSRYRCDHGRVLRNHLPVIDILFHDFQNRFSTIHTFLRIETKNGLRRCRHTAIRLLIPDHVTVFLPGKQSRPV